MILTTETRSGKYLAWLQEGCAPVGLKKPAQFLDQLLCPAICVHNTKFVRPINQKLPYELYTEFWLVYIHDAFIDAGSRNISISACLFWNHFCIWYFKTVLFCIDKNKLLIWGSHQFLDASSCHATFSLHLSPPEQQVLKRNAHEFCLLFWLPLPEFYTRLREVSLWVRLLQQVYKK